MSKKCRHTHITVKGCDQCLIAELEAELQALRKLAERTCGDGCHCMEENNEECALAALQPPEAIQGGGVCVGYSHGVGLATLKAT